MRIHRSKRPNGLVIVTDWTAKTDRQLDQAEGGTHVLEFWKYGKEAYGDQYARTTRVALFEHGDTPSNKQAAQARDEWRMFLEVERPSMVVVLPTPDASSGEKYALKGTQAWAALDAPDALDDMRGAFWRRGASYISPHFPVVKRSKELQLWVMSRWSTWALDVSKDPRFVGTAPRKDIHVNGQMLQTLQAMRGRHVAVDLEFVPATGVITAIGLAVSNVGAVSIPWDTFTPPRAQEPEPGIRTYGQIGFEINAEVTRLLADPATAKIAHNFIADVPRLESRGLRVAGPIHDTFAAHAIAFPELRHGLQHACASMFPCQPWKSLWKPSSAKGLTRDDSEFWICEPLGLRDYNADDAWHTAVLADLILPCVGVKL